jgi:hypothetical protein
VGEDEDEAEIGVDIADLTYADEGWTKTTTTRRSEARQLEGPTPFETHPDGVLFYSALCKFGLENQEGLRRADVESTFPYHPPKHPNRRCCEICGFKDANPNTLRLHRFIMKHGDWVGFISFAFIGLQYHGLNHHHQLHFITHSN